VESSAKDSRREDTRRKTMNATKTSKTANPPAGPRNTTRKLFW
jgi:hypothetical protein